MAKTIVKSKKTGRERAAIMKNRKLEIDVENVWQQMFILTKYWQSDLTFFHEEVNFFHKLISKYLTWLIEDKNVERTRKAVHDLTKCEKRISTLDQKVNVHVKHIGNLIENPFAHDANVCKIEHAELQTLMSSLVNEFREVKKGIFQLTENMMRSEKAKRLLDS